MVLKSNLNSLQWTASGLTSGLYYKFKVEARTSFGFSDATDEVSILCAAAPSQVDVPTSYTFEDSVVFDWSEPVTNGLQIDAYTIYFR